MYSGKKPLTGSTAPQPTHEQARFDVVALVASAGGLEALSAVLREIPDNLPAAIIIAQHLGGQGSALVNILRQRSGLPVEWASAGDRLVPGRVLVGPARRQLEILPDGTCTIGHDISARDKPLDMLLESVADSYGSRALVVVLTGMGKDAAAGALAVKRAGGVVLVQSEETAEQPSMPRAAIASGASDLVLPLHEIGSVITDVVTGGELPRPRAELEAAEALFAGAGDVRRLLREIDWSRTPLGPLARWPGSLRTMLRLVLDSPMPMLMFWGTERVHVYNEPYRLLMGVGHDEDLGQATRASMSTFWHLDAETYARVLSGESVALNDAPYPITRRGLLTDAWFDLSFTPVRAEGGVAVGVLATIVETTARVLSQRRLGMLQVLTMATAAAPSVYAAMQRALESLGDITAAGNEHAQDMPFALGYLLDRGHERAQLAACTGVEAGSGIAPRTIGVRNGHPAWPLGSVLTANTDRSSLLLDDVAKRFPGAVFAHNERRPTSAMLLPLRPVASEPPAGALICGLNPNLVVDDAYRGFLELVASRVSASIAEAQVRQHERDRLQRLADLDRAKTEFFSNVSHEFRTPLTLLLAPLEELSRRETQLPEPVGEELRVAARHARQLLNQVNTLLDFSQAEAARLRARFEPTNLSSLTRDIASVFHGAAERAGIQLRVECPPLSEPVWVDPQMWEKIVSNLLSNALKFTFRGEIVVELTARAKHAELTVRDTGVGIPADDQIHVFKRFHRVKGRRGRTNDGSGIGLALVYELARLHQGRVRVNSEEGLGTTFTVWVPMGRRPHRDLALDPPAEPVATAWSPEVAAAMAEEAATWVADSHAGDDEDDREPLDIVDAVLGPPRSPPRSGPAADRARVLVVEDNSDMRDYLRRLLEGQWKVSVACDGVAAFEQLRRIHPDAVLADVKMPGLDGFELLARIRGDAQLKFTPVVLVTARAGEEEAIAGLHAGADDYLAKPFSSRELLARVGAVIERSRVEAALRERTAWLRAQREALEAAVDGAPLDVSLGPLVRAATEALGDGTRAAFYLADAEGTTLHHVVGTSDEYTEAVNGFRIGPESLACGVAAAAGQAVLTEDVMTDPRWVPWRWMAERFDYRGCWSFPIHTVAGRFIGTFAAYSRQPRQATQRDQELAMLLTQTASIIISRHAESEARKEADAALRQSNEDALHELENAQHLQRVSSLLIEPGREALHEQILDAAMTITHADCGSIQMLDDASGALDLLAWRNFHAESAAYWKRISLATASSGGLALKRGERVIVPDVQTAVPDVFLGVESSKHYERCGIKAAQFTPLITREGKLVGVMATHWRRVHTPSPRELLLFDVLARQAADFFERRSIQEALRAGEERLMRMTAVPGVGILTFDSDSGTLLEANDAFLTMSGYTRRQVEQRELTWRTMTPPEYTQSIEREMQRLGESGRSGPYEKEYFRADGSRARLLFAGASLGNGKFVKYCVDIADRIAATTHNGAVPAHRRHVE